jgi:subtilisin family serine protease
MPGSGRTWVVFLVAIWLALPLSAAARESDAAPAPVHRYIVQLQDPPLARYDGRELADSGRNAPDRLEATAPQFTGSSKLNMASPATRSYLGYLENTQERFRQESAVMLGRRVDPVYTYRVATNGMALDLTEEDAAELAGSPSVKSIQRDVRHHLETFAGPRWIGAGEIWSGASGYSAHRGEGIVIGVIDSGINWDHPSFSDPSQDGYVYSNPLGAPLGLCDDPEVSCSNKIIGVYDFVEDDPSTADYVEENTKGRDNDGHGSHVAAIAAGNPVNVTLNGNVQAQLSGVAPRANLIVYRVCYVGDPPGADTSGCMGSAILSAIDQAVQDGVDVINYSIGTDASNPWAGGSIAQAYLAARGAGVFVVTSAGNSGPNPGTIGSPANAPWILAVGNSTHDMVYGNRVHNLTGGDTEPPDDLVGASFTGGTGQRVIVHARDYGNALCGEGPAELAATCDHNTGASNPWAGEKPFNGEIVVCDRGTYGRVEKGKNVMLAGAGGYILANTPEFGESVEADEHCLPATHIGVSDGDKLRAWLASGSGHGGSITAFDLESRPASADQVNVSSSRGPAQPPVEDILKPNVIAPGTAILAATENDSEFGVKTGTSMSSPHIAGAAALIKSVHGDWSVSQIASAIETTATPELATDQGIGPATPQVRGAGRPQLGEAVNAGLYLNVTQAQFASANPALSGTPYNLNLPGLVYSHCQGTCDFNRTVTDQMGGGNWTTAAEDFPEGVSVTVTPANFTLSNGGSRSLAISVNVTDSGIVGDWVSGRIRLSAAGSSDQYLTVSVFSYGGDLPESWSFTDNRNGGSKMFELSGLSAMTDATFRAGGLVSPTRTEQVLVEDPSRDDPYNGGSGVYTVWHNLPEGGLWLYAETLATSAEDLDLFVGRDDDGDHYPDESEELCNSTTPQALERCDLFDVSAGNYWVMVQNWSGTNEDGDVATLLSAGIGPSSDSRLAASGPGIVGPGESFEVRLSWDNLAALPGEEWLGAVGIGTQRDKPNNIGVIPVRLSRAGIAAPATFPLMDGRTHRLALAAGGTHNGLFIDVPPGADSLTVTATGLGNQGSDDTLLKLVRMDFDDALANPPFAADPSGAAVVTSTSGDGPDPAEATVSGGQLQPGRWYALLTNQANSPRAFEVEANVTFTGDPIDVRRGLWEPNSRPGLGQGYEYHGSGGSGALLWYTYDNDGQPTWYIAGSPLGDGNIWVSDLYRVTNDGAEQQLAPVGAVSVTNLAADDQLFSFTLFGESGTDRFQPLTFATCPQINGQGAASYTGLWYRGVDGLGGASVVVNDVTQAQIHYLFDDHGYPRWLFAQDLVHPAPTLSTLPLLQFHGYCAVCDSADVDSQEVGTAVRTFTDESHGSWTLDYMFDSPLSGSVDRTDSIVKLTERIDCQ